MDYLEHPIHLQIDSPTTIAKKFESDKQKQESFVNYLATLILNTTYNGSGNESDNKEV